MAFVILAFVSGGILVLSQNMNMRRLMGENILRNVGVPYQMRRMIAMSEPHPIQPFVNINGTIRFKENAIVRFLLDAGPFDLNQLAVMPFSDEDREQFAMLIGYSFNGFGELGYVSSDTYQRAKARLQDGEGGNDGRLC